MDTTPEISKQLFDALSEIMDGAYVGEWLKAANPAFDNGPVCFASGLVVAPLLGSAPLQVIERGEADRIWHTCHGVTPWRRMIYRLQTGEPIYRTNRISSGAKAPR